MQRRVSNRRVLPDAYGTEAIFAAATGERRVVQGHAHVKRYGGVQAQGLIDDVLEVWHILQILIRRRTVRA